MLEDVCASGKVPGVPEEPEGLHLLQVREVPGSRHVATAHPLGGGERAHLQEVQAGHHTRVAS